MTAADWDAVIMHLRATAGQEQLVAANVGTNRVRALMGKGLKIRAHKTSMVPVRFDIYATAPVTEQPYRIMTLVEMCSGILHEVAGDTSPRLSAAIGWLKANPGRWFLVGEYVADKATGRRHILGIDPLTLTRYELEQATVNNKIYGRVPDASGLPITDFVTRSHARKSDPLPELERDAFGWSLAELRTAASTAADWLRGTETHAAAA